MNPTTVQMDQKEEEILSFEVPTKSWKAPQRPRWPRLTRSPHAPAYWFARARPAHRMNRFPAHEAEPVVFDLVGPGERASLLSVCPTSRVIENPLADFGYVRGSVHQPGLDRLITAKPIRVV
jgi:hypothetical protein